MTHRALVVDRAGGDGTGGGGAVAASIRERADPTPVDGEVEIDVSYSSINFKDALAVTGRPGVIRSYPLVAGIDAVGVIAGDGTADWRPGTAVAVTGAGHGERRDGGFANRMVADARTIVAVPEGFSLGDAAAIGTAGFTAALCVLALERSGIPDGPVLVTGSGGGVGGFAVALLAARGHVVSASTGRADGLRTRLTALGATDVVDRLETDPGRPLQAARWAGIVDSVGGAPLVNAIAQTMPGGAVAACGLAAGADLPGTVLPFILRGVGLLGVNSVDVDATRRHAAWALLAEHVTPEIIAAMVDRTIPLDEVVRAAADVLGGRIDGRVVVDIGA